MIKLIGAILIMIATTWTGFEAAQAFERTT